MDRGANPPGQPYGQSPERPTGRVEPDRDIQPPPPGIAVPGHGLRETHPVPSTSASQALQPPEWSTFRATGEQRPEVPEESIIQVTRTWGWRRTGRM